jgi:hypothetical protein
MRPKASLGNLQLAAAFADSLSVLSEDSRVNAAAIRCRGPTSYFAALKVGIPEIVRAHDGGGQKGAISEMEFNKFLASLGYVSFRYRHRIRGTKDKWSRGVQLWKHFRWLDPGIPDELDLIKSQLSQLKTRFPGTYSIEENEIISFLASIPFGCDKKDSASDSNDEQGVAKGKRLATTSALRLSTGGSSKFRDRSQPCEFPAQRHSVLQGVLRQGQRETIEPIPHPHFTTLHRCLRTLFILGCFPL